MILRALPSLTKLDETRRERVENNVQTAIDRLRGVTYEIKPGETREMDL